MPHNNGDMAVVLRLLPLLLLIGAVASFVPAWTSSPLTCPSHLGSVKLAVGRGGDADTDGNELHSHLVSKLDLQPLVEHVAGYSRFKRGKESLLSLVNDSEDNTSGRRKAGLFPGQAAKRRRQDWFDRQRLVWKRKRGRDGPAVHVAKSADEAISEFNLVRQAMDVLSVQKNSPPLFRLNNGEPSEVESDEDEWVDLCTSDLPPGMDLFQEIDLQTVLQAEQVIKLVMDTIAWADELRESAPELADVMLRLGRPVPCDDQTEKVEDDEDERSTVDGLVELHQSLRGAVEIFRSGPSLSDPYNRLSYIFRLSSDSARFPELNKLRRKEEKLLQADVKKNQQLAMVQNEISVVENLITRKLITSMISGAADAVSRLFCGRRAH